MLKIRWAVPMAVLFGMAFSLGASASEGGTCAVIFAGQNFDGPSEAIQAGARMANLGDLAMENQCDETWDNQAASMLVMPRCTVTAYQYQNFDINYDNGQQIGGQIRVFANDGYHRVRHVNFVDYGFYRMMSSLTCDCN